MLITYDKAAAKYVEVRKEIERINSEAKTKVSELNKIIADLENWFALKAQEEGLQKIPTLHGTVYWSNISTASVGEPAVFKQYVIDNGAWDLLETRAARLAVKSFVDAHGVPPPGVNFSSIKNFNLRATANKE